MGEGGLVSSTISGVDVSAHSYGVSVYMQFR